MQMTGPVQESKGPSSYATVTGTAGKDDDEDDDVVSDRTEAPQMPIANSNTASAAQLNVRIV